MNYRTLGSSELRVSELGFGTGDNAGLMVLGSERERVAAVERALALGINFFDTSPDYGKGVGETNLGAALRQLGARDAIVSTKVEIMPPDLDDICGKVVRSIDGSLQRLGMDSVDLLLIHNPPRLQRNTSITAWTPLTVDDMLGPALEGLEKVRAAGTARHFGFACEGAEPAAVRPVLDSGRFTIINAWYNLVNPTSGMEMPAGIVFGPDYDDYGGIIDYALQRNVGVAVIRPLAGGALVPAVHRAGIAGRHPLAGGGYARRPETFRPELARGRCFGFLDGPDCSLPQNAYRFILGHPAVTTVVGGYSDLSHLEELALTSGMPPLAPAELAQIAGVYRRNFDLGG